MTDNEFDNILKIITISIGILVIFFCVSFIVYHCNVTDQDAKRTFADKSWVMNKGVFHRQTNCWGEIIYSIGDKQIQYGQSWVTKDHSTIVYANNLQEGIIYSTYEKHYSFLFLPDNFSIIESDNCGD